MPQFVFAAAAFAFQAGASYLISGALLLGGVALSYTQAKSAKRKARNEFNAAQQDRLVNISSTVAPRDLVLGRVRKGGSVFFRGSTGPNKTTFVMLVALAGHEIDRVVTVYLNDVAVTLDASGNVLTAPYALTSTYSQTDYGGTLSRTPIPGTDRYFTGSTAGPEGNIVEWSGIGAWDTATYQYTETTYNANIRAVLGTDSQAADAELQSIFPGVWTAAHRARAVAYLICKFTYSETAFPTGLPVVTAVIRGAKVYDPRSGLTAWSNNPALLMRHVYQHASFGKATVSAAEDARITTAANACETSTAYVVAGVTDTRVLYRANLVAPFGSAPKDLFDDLSQAMAGTWAFAGGELYLKAGTHTASVVSLTDADLAVVQRNGSSESQIPIGIAVHKERSSKFNTVNVQLWDAAQDHKQVTLTPLTSSALVTRDGAVLSQSVTYPAINYAPQAQHVAGVMMRDARDPLTVILPFKLRAYPLELFDTVDLTIARYGWSGKLFTVLARDWSNEGALKLTLKETAASIHALDAEFAAQGGATNTSLPNPWYLAPPGALTVTSGTAELTKQADGTVVSRIRITWPALSDSSVTQGGTVEVQYREVLSDQQWTSVQISGNETQLVIEGVQDANIYTIRARARNRLAVSDWGMQVVHQVLGKTEPPPDVANFLIDGTRLTWTAVSALDLSGYEIRFNYGNNTWWDGAAALHDGTITDTPYTMGQRPTGTITLLIKAVDTTGNYSANAAVIVVDLGDQVFANIYLSWPQAPTFADGSISGGAVSGGTLQATATDFFYGPDPEPFYGPDTEDFYVAGTYSDMSYTWPVLITAPGTLLIVHDITASNYTIEYQRDSQAAFYGADADYFYGADADAFYGSAAAWATWPGPLAIVATEYITLRISVVGGDVQGVITAATPQLDVPDVIESFSDIVIAPAGTRLPITLTYREIVNISLTTQADGNGGITARTEDKDATLGPLVKVFDASGAAVTGLIDAQIQGY